MAFTVVLDACVLIPGSLRDILLIAAERYLFTIQLTDDILDEVSRNLIKQGLSEDKARRIISAIHTSFEDAIITRHKPLIEMMPINTKDRHVLAAAVACKADIIVTQNIKDFPEKLLSPYEVEALTPDRFLIDLYNTDPMQVVEVIFQQASNLRHPPMTVSEVLDKLKLHIPEFVKLVRDEHGFPTT